MANDYVHKALATASLSDSLVAVYTASTNKAILHVITLCNTGDTTRVVTVKARDKVLFNDQLLAKETKMLSGPHVLEDTHTLQAQQDAGTDVDLLASGVEVIES